MKLIFIDENDDPTNLKDVNGNMDEVVANFKDLKQIMSRFDRGPMSHYVELLTTAYSLLVTKYSPFQIGDVVVLTKTPDFSTSPGWEHSKHFLVKGASAIVQHIDVSVKANCLVFSVAFYNESYYATAGGEPILVEANERHTFWFSDSYLVKV